MIFNKKNGYYAEYQGSIKREGISEAKKRKPTVSFKGKGSQGVSFAE